MLQVGQKRWKLDINSHQDGILMLSAVNLPGNVQASLVMSVAAG